MKLYEYGDLKRVISPKPYSTRKGEFDNNIFCFDIEVTSAWYTPERKIIPFDKTKGKKYWKNCVPLSLVYIWQFGVNDIVFYGRYLDDFSILLNELRECVVNPTIWVHNLSYEFQFLLNITDINEVFARKPHKPMYVDIEGIRFRCSYFLTRLSLANWGKEVGIVEKAVGKLDYSLIRTPKTHLTDENLDYCERDILVMYHGLKEYLKKYTFIERIPLTQTGEVRRVIKDKYKYNNNYHRKMTKLLPRNAKEYTFMKDCYSGGYTHANYIHANMVHTRVKSKDISSSYPTVMICEKFPMSKWAHVPEWKLADYRHNDKYSLLLDITLYDVKPKCSMTYISASKCYDKGKPIRKGNKTVYDIKTDNGRILTAKQISLRCTNIDLDIIEKCYTFKKIKYNKILYSVNDYLDAEYVRYVLELYGNKTSYKDVEGKEAIYTTSKQFINSLYGMMVTDIVNDNCSFIDDMWKTNKADIEDRLDELRSQEWKNFLAYQHGIFIAAYARRNLWDVILQIDKDVLYVDTDSVKYIGDHEDVFDRYNKQIVEKIKVSTSKLNIPFALTHPKTPDKIENGKVVKKGVEKQIGIYETEKPYYEFITLGAKRYAYKYSPDGDVHITVSGVNKIEGAKALKDIHDFRPDFVFDTDYTKKLIFTYLNDMPPILWKKGDYDEYISHQRYGINALPTTYSMSLSDEYTDLLLRGLQNYM